MNTAWLFEPPLRDLLRPQRSRGIRRALVLFVLSLGLTGCLGTKFVFNQLDWVIAWRLNSFFSLNAEQEQRLREIVSRNLDWVRQEQFPGVVLWLRNVEADVSANAADPDRLAAHYEELVAYWDGFLIQVTPDAAGFLAGLSPEQVESLIGNMRDNNDELWEEFAGSTPEDRLRRRQKATIKNLQRFTGRLSKDQRELVAGYVGQLHDNAAEWMEGRRAWQARFRDLLLERPPPEEFRIRLQAMSLNPNDLDSEDYRGRVAENFATVFSMLAAVINSLDEKQRGRFSRRLLGLAADLDTLATQ